MEPCSSIIDDNYSYNDKIEDEYPSSFRIIEYYPLSNLIEGKNEEFPKADFNDPKKIIKFKITKRFKHGREISKDFIGKKIHSSNSNDNILCKMHIHFLKFLVNFANDAIEAVIKNKKRTKLEFKHIEHSIKIKISKIYLGALVRKSIGDVLQLDISKKYKKLSLDKNYNKNIYNKVIALSSWLKKLFDMDYLDAFKLYYNDCLPLKIFELITFSSNSNIFKLYYNDCLPLKIFEFEEKVINFSKKTKSFFCLYEAENEEKKYKLKSMAEDHYLKLGNPTDSKSELTAEL